MSGFGSNPVTTTQGTLATNQFPISSVAVPGAASGNLTALEGGPASTDGNGNSTAPASMYVKDGGNVAQGTTTDAAYSGSGAGTEIALLKKLVALLAATLTISGTVTSNAGTNTSTASLALETGGNLASLATSNTAVNTAVGTQADVAWSGSGSGSEIAILKKIVAELAGTIAVSGTFWQATQPVSAASFPLPTGASTAAKQPALGTAGSASSDVLSVQGIASMTPMKVDGSGVTQPISGTFWQATQPVSGTITANVGTTNGLALDTSVNGVIVSQGSTTLGEKGPLVQGAVTTSAPTYTTAQTSPISLTTAGAIRTDASATTQPVSGTVTANQGGTWTVQPGNTANTTAWKVDGSAVTQPVSGTVTANAGTNMSTASLALESGGNLATLAGGVTSSKYQANHAQVSGTAVSVNAGNRDAGTQRFIEAGNGTSAVTQVASSASDGSLLAANTAKKGTLFYNDSTATLYLLYGTGVSSTTNYSVQIPPKSFFEDPMHYTGGFHGIWSAANGFVYITEVS